MGEQPFTVLLPVYRGDDPGFFRAAYRSVTVEQTLPPDYVLIVQDGPVNSALDAVVREFENDATTSVLRLPANSGLAYALNAGLANVTTEIVARADADDVCLPQRFATQIPIIAAGADIVGSSIAEFDTDPGSPSRIRRVETDPERLRRNARFESPFHHPTIVYRASAVAKAGGYRDVPLLEDYLLWGAMIQSGARVANCADVLLCYRVGSGAYGRRGGTGIMRSEFALQREFRRMGFTTRRQYIRNIAIRCFYRLVPEPVRRWAYRVRQRMKNARMAQV